MRAILASAASIVRDDASSSPSGAAELQHAVVGRQQHKVGRVLLQCVAVVIEPRFGLLIFHQRHIKQKSEADRGADQGVGEMRSG